MQITVNHLTRMRESRICVAGIDAATLEHIRPTTRAEDPITRDLLRESGGPFGVGAVVELGPVTPWPRLPESEDHRFRTTSAWRVRDLTDDEYLALLDDVSTTGLEDAFGPELERVSERKYAVEVGRGTRSLAVLAVAGKPWLGVNRWGKLELALRSPDPGCILPVTDLRFYEADATIKSDLVADANRRLRRGVGAFVMLGLARAWSKSAEEPARHWLQANGLCLADRPVGDAP